MGVYKLEVRTFIFLFVFLIYPVTVGIHLLFQVIHPCENPDIVRGVEHEWGVCDASQISEVPSSVPASISRQDRKPSMTARQCCQRGAGCSLYIRKQFVLGRNVVRCSKPKESLFCFNMGKTFKLQNGTSQNKREELMLERIAVYDFFIQASKPEFLPSSGLLLGRSQHGMMEALLWGTGGKP